MHPSFDPGSFVDVSRPRSLLATFELLENNLRSKSVSRQSTTDTISLDINVHNASIDRVKTEGLHCFS